MATDRFLPVEPSLLKSALDKTSRHTVFIVLYKDTGSIAGAGDLMTTPIILLDQPVLIDRLYGLLPHLGPQFSGGSPQCRHLILCNRSSRLTHHAPAPLTPRTVHSQS